MTKMNETDEKFYSEYMPVMDALLDKHALDITAIDLRAISAFADVLILATARSDVNARTLSDAVQDSLEDMGIPFKIEGAPGSKWSLIDAGNVIVNIFSREGRSFYDLEKLWGDAPMERIKNEDDI